MATPVWLGRQKKRKQITTVQITGYDAATTYTLGIPSVTGVTVTVIAAGSVSLTATALASAWNAVLTGPMTRVTASAATDTVTLTADNEGEPFTVASGVAGGAGTIGAATTSTTNQSPNDWNDVVNWSTGATPQNSDDVVLSNADEDALYNLGANTNTPSTLRVFGTWDASLGLREMNPDGSYWEYRSRYMTLGVTTTFIGNPDGSGPNLFMHNNGATAGTWHIWGSGRNSEADVPCILLRGSSASNVLNMMGGTAGIAFFGGETANFSGGLTVAGGELTCGTGCTLSGVTQSGGVINTSSALGAVTQFDGTHIHRAGNITTLTLNGGTFEIRSNTAVTITNLTLNDGAILDLSLCDAAVTVSNTATLKGAWRIIDPQNCLGRGGSFVYTEPDGIGSGTLERGRATATITVA